MKIFSGIGNPSTSVTAIPGEPAQVKIKSFPNLNVPNIGTEILITNEGTGQYEYQYTWCVNSSPDSLCSVGNNVFSSTAAKLIQPGQDWDTVLNSTVPNSGNYYFHINVQYGSELSVADQPFTAVGGSSGGSPSSTNGGDGGGSFIPVIKPVIPVGGFKIIVNQGVVMTDNRIVNLNFNAGADIKKMAISLTGDFSDASVETYQPTKQLDLCSGFASQIKNSTCPNGQYIVYVKFYNQYGVASSVISQNINLSAPNGAPDQITPPTTLPTVSSPASKTPIVPSKSVKPAPSAKGQSAVFTHVLYQGVHSADVSRLQKILASDPKIYPQGIITGYFGALTKKAVGMFQIKYHVDSVTNPNSYGFGYVGPKTRAKLKEVFEKYLEIVLSY